MRSKAAWWSCVILFAALYGCVGLAATFAQAFETLFDRHESLSVLRFSGGWIVIAVIMTMTLTFMATIILSAFAHGRAAAVGTDLMRLETAAFWGALVPLACGGEHPWIYAPLAVGGAALTLLFDRRGPSRDRPWQTWALAALAVLVAAPVLFISRL